MKLSIAYDYQIFASQEYGGISRYLYELAKCLSDDNRFCISIISPFYVNRYLENDNRLNIFGTYIPKNSVIKRKLLRCNELISNMYMRLQRPDIIHETYYSPVTLGSRASKRVLTVHDMIHEKHSEYFSTPNITSAKKKTAVQRADHIICVSESTKSDLSEILNIPLSSISVIYHGYTFSGAKLNNSASAPLIEGQYILFVGLRGGYKNFALLLNAFGEDCHLKNEFKLVCFGGGAFSEEEIEHISKYGLLQQVISTHGNNDVLLNLYQHAAVFVYPSLYEGFGIPILEAMSMECPVACSSTGSMPEVAGQAAVYFDPMSKESIAKSINDVVYSPEKSASLKSLGLKRCAEFSWEKCARQTAEVYKSLK